MALASCNQFKANKLNLTMAEINAACCNEYNTYKDSVEDEFQKLLKALPTLWGAYSSASCGAYSVRMGQKAANGRYSLPLDYVAVSRHSLLSLRKHCTSPEN